MQGFFPRYHTNSFYSVAIFHLLTDNCHNWAYFLCLYNVMPLTNPLATRRRNTERHSLTMITIFFLRWTLHITPCHKPILFWNRDMHLFYFFYLYKTQILYLQEKTKNICLNGNKDNPLRTNLVILTDI